MGLLLCKFFYYDVLDEKVTFAPCIQMADLGTFYG
jgi:hypothetical protein